MAELRFSSMLLPVLVLLLVAAAAAAFSQNGSTDGGGGRPAMVPAMFIFGDSLIDNGNNNNLPTFARANYFPYGIDFADGPTGRFSNGYTIVDEIAKLLGLPLIPPSAAPTTGPLRGLNYASAASGILDITGRNFIGRIPFNQQIRNFENTLDQITGNLGAATVAPVVARCIFFVGMGSNDYLNNYLMPNYPTRSQYNSRQFADLLTQQYTQQLSRLYNLGARKFIIPGIGTMECIPNVLARSSDGRCSEEVSQLVRDFNANVRVMIGNLNANLPGSRFTYVNIARMNGDILANPRAYGFTVADRGCCGIGRNRGQITCLPYQMPCLNRDQYVFWDAFHPTERVNIIMARRAFNGDMSVAYPFNIQQLANLDI
ncbi:GDSL esterase/lipase At1g71691-like isoform X1 [Cucurbita pepo subsp. pepo]|uniref:GDSL esterase/lipase At1g71691-like isoform X1 n=1 Tax=Cucurbita pepo subsp. pepo TaxID=3664 RepID=UPI000C9D2F08|nr:GDSL esterase/lipase At1g71691-like isoform X1 [Cucurbita pepo subsp. pepo]